jgi:metal iron transporter
MNCPSRVDPEFPEGYNQNPNALNADATTRSDLGFIVNARARDDHTIDRIDSQDDKATSQEHIVEEGRLGASKARDGLRRRSDASRHSTSHSPEENIRSSGILHLARDDISRVPQRGGFAGVIKVIRKYLTFIGPGFMVAVAYIDPGKPSVKTLPSVALLAIDPLRSGGTNLGQETMLRTSRQAPLSNTNFSLLY